MITSLSIKSHVIAIDYRGFGDSSNVIPTETGVRIDARSAYDWILEQGVEPCNIIIVGHSLGSGVATDLVHQISLDHAEKKSPVCGGLVLFSGYASIADAAIGYPNVPLLRPFLGSKVLEPLVKKVIRDQWTSHQKMPFIPVPILLMHGKQDYEIKPWHSKALFFEAIGGRVGKKFFQDGYWDLRSQKPFNKLESCKKIDLDGDEGEIWCFDNIWLLLANHAGHNTLSIHQIVNDTLESWLLSTNKNQ